MNNFQQKKSHQYIAIVASSMAILVVIASVVYVKRHALKEIFSATPQNTATTTSPVSDPPKTNVVDYGPSTPSDNDQINQQKNDAGKPLPPPTNSSIAATITNTRVTDALAQVSVLVTGATEGTCKLSLSKAGATTVEKTTAIITKESVITCQNFDVPVSQLSTGSWKAEVVLLTTTGQSKVAQGTLQVN
jgi:phosphohistidine swiveling domain-containing protein